MLTDRQRQTLDYLREYHAERGYAPKLDEIGAHLGIRSRGTVHRHLKALEQAGLIEILSERARGVRLLEASSELIGRLPLLGRIAAGRPIEAIAGQEYIDLSRFFVGPGRFVLRVQGDSMIEDGILDGDMVVIASRNNANNGDIVVALIDNLEATLKRFYRNGDASITLKPANSDMQPMRYPAARIQIQGVVVGQFRAYD